jgi:hypothetical protein
MQILNMQSGYVPPPPDVEHVVVVGFLELWLTRNMKRRNGLKGKLFYPHQGTISAYRWLFPIDNMGQRKWTTIDKFTSDAQEALHANLVKRLKELP